MMVGTPALVYAGGAIDYIKEQYHKTDGWQHHLATLVEPRYTIYCPKCVNEGHTDDAAAVIDRNMRAMLEGCSRAVFVFAPEHFTMGTPIEAWQWATRKDPRSMCIVHPAPAGLFLESWASQGAVVVDTLEEAAEWLLGSR